MIRIWKSEVPEYLHRSDLYTFLADEEEDGGGEGSDEGGFEVPLNCYMQIPQIESEQDLVLLLSTLRFWGVHETPIFLIERMLSGFPCNEQQIEEKFGEELSEIVTLFTVRKEPKAVERLFLALNARSSIDLVRYLLSTMDLVSCPNALCKLDQRFCDAAAAWGLQDCLELLRSNGFAWSSNTSASAARGGHLGCLQYARENGCEWSSCTCAEAARGGHLACLIYAHEGGCDWDKDTTEAAAGAGHLACLQYAHESGCPLYAKEVWSVRERGCPLRASDACSIAAENGHLHCMKYLRAHDAPMGRNTCTFAASGGHLACLQFAHEQGCPWTVRVTQMAAAYKQYACLKYAVEQGCPVTAKCLEVYHNHCVVHAEVFTWCQRQSW